MCVCRSSGTPIGPRIGRVGLPAKLVVCEIVAMPRSVGMLTKADTWPINQGILMSAYSQRRSRAIALLERAGLGAAAFVPGANFAYLTGVHLHLMERSTLFVLARDGRTFAVMPALEHLKWSAAMPRTETFYWDDADGPREAFAKLAMALGTDEAMGVEGLRMRAAEYIALARHWPSQGIVDADAAMTDLRLLKDADEIADLRQAIAISEAALGEVLEGGIGGRTERQLAARLRSAMLAHGASGFAFDPIVLTGGEAANPHGDARRPDRRAGAAPADRFRGELWRHACRHHADGVLRSCQRYPRRDLRDGAGGQQGRARGGSPAAREFAALTRLRTGTRPFAPEPLAVLEEREHGFLRSCHLLLREVPAARDLATWLGDTDDGPRRRSVLSELATRTAEMHANGILDGDMHPRNVLVDADDRVWKVDCPRQRTAARAIAPWARRVRPRVPRRRSRAAGDAARTRAVPGQLSRRRLRAR